MSQNVIYDPYYMQNCLTLATRGWGTTLTNPLVGALVVKNNRIIGQGYHRKLGEAHAEVIALVDAGTRAKNATLYVNLEPCCCAGRTPPCVTSIIQAGIRRVVVGMTDPNPLVNGKGIQLLRTHGIEVATDVLRERAYDLNRSYCTFITRHLPHTILKIAVSRNGKLSGFKERYITSPASLRHVHALRSRVSGVLIGKNTVLSDDPRLTDRFVGRHDPARIIMDPDLEVPINAHVFEKGAWRIVFTHHKTSEKIEALRKRGVEIFFTEKKLLPLLQLLNILGNIDIGSLLVEGGGMVFEEFYSENMYDEIYLFMTSHHVEEGKSLTDSVLRSIVSRDVHYEMIGEDRLYHVYRDN